MYRDTNKHIHTQKTTSQKHLYLLLFIFSVFSSSLSYFEMSTPHKKYFALIYQPLTKMHITELCIDDIE
jgi:hypothetical protein